MEDKVLSGALILKNKEELIEILSFFDIKVPKSSLRKVLLEKVSETFDIQNSEFVQIFSKETQLFINKIIQKDFKIDEAIEKKNEDSIIELEYLGLIARDYREEDLPYRLSKVFAEKFSLYCRTAQGKKELKSSDDLERFLVGIIRFYGIISKDDLSKIVIKVSREFKEEEIAKFLEKRMFLKLYFPKIFIKGTDEFYYFSDFSTNRQELVNEFFLRPDIEYKILDKKEYQNFWKLDYYIETEMTIEMENLYRSAGLGKQLVKECMSEIILNIQKGDSFNEIIKRILANLGSENKTIDEMNKILNIVQKFYNTTSQWVLKGHSPEEVFRTQQKNIMMR